MHHDLVTHFCPCRLECVDFWVVGCTRETGWAVVVIVELVSDMVGSGGGGVQVLRNGGREPG